MIEKKEFTLALPTKDSDTTDISTKRSIVIIGANGSGKTRLGTWIEFNSPQKDHVHRISAQKSLNMPDSSSPVSIEKAKCHLLFGYPDVQEGQGFAYKQGHRWGSKPATILLNDYQELMVYLFSEQNERSSEYLAKAKKSEERLEPPTTKLDIIQDLWEKTLPHRELIIGGANIETRVQDKDLKYNASEMSDGERIIFYLAGQCLAAPDNGIIVIDEPEMHLHKSIQVSLWQELEFARPDCLFVYLTHDVGFAASQETANKIWLKSYDGQNWDWETVSKVEEFPEELLLQIIGSRKPIIFVEGDNGSFDVALYRAFYKNHLIIPRGTCHQVIASTKSLRENKQLHHLKVYGIVDMDRRAEEEIKSLKKNGISVLDVAEIENLFCVTELIRIVSENLELDPDKKIKEVSDFAFACLTKELDVQISLRTANEIKFRLNSFGGKATSRDELQQDFDELRDSIDIEKLYAENHNLYESIIKTKDYLKLLKYYNRKSLSSRLSNIFALKEGELPEYIIRMTKGNNKEKVEKALENYLPNI